MSSNWRTQRASDVIRDGLGVELIGPGYEVLAEVFRCDSDHTLTVSIFERLPFSAVEWLIGIARDEVGAFEDGTPLPPPLSSSSGRKGTGS